MSKSGQTAAALPAQDPKKRRRIKKELDHLEEIFRDIDPNKRDFVQRQIEQLAWYCVNIADLQAKVDQWGTLIMYDNGGGQSGVKPNPDVKTLLDYQKCCNTIIRTLIPLVPDKGRGSRLDALRLDFDLDNDPEDWEEQQRKEDERQKKIKAELDRAIEIQRKEREQAAHG